MCWELLEKMREIGKSAGLGCVALGCAGLCSALLWFLDASEQVFCPGLPCLKRV